MPAGGWLTPTLDNLVAIDGLLEPRPARPSWPPWTRWPAPPTPVTPASGSQRTADALTELAHRHLEAGLLPTVGGGRPQLAVILDLNRLHHPTGGLGGDTGWAGRPSGCPDC